MTLRSAVLLQRLALALTVLFLLYRQVAILRPHHFYYGNPEGNADFEWNNTHAIISDNNSNINASPVCAEAPSLPWTFSELMYQWNDSHNVVPVYRSHDEFMRLPQRQSPGNTTAGKKTTREEVQCYFAPWKHSPHFPHAMQQIYRCWSYFRAHPTKQPVLLYPHGARRFPREGSEFQPATTPRRPSWRHRNGPVARAVRKYRYAKKRRRRNHETKERGMFLEGFLAAMETHLGVVLRPINESSPHALDQAAVYIPRDGFALFPADAQALVDGFFPAHHHPRHSLRGLLRPHFPRPITPCSCSSRNQQQQQPRVAILNRKGSRQLLNSDAIVAAVRQSTQLETVEVAYFEGTGFWEQISFFARTDILVSPHGAQLTGLPFVRRPCGAVLEIYPPGYCMPYYYGSLTASSGLNHSYLALGEGPCRDGGIRSVKLCPSVDVIVNAVHTLVQQWQACCSSFCQQSKT